jgi:hypothetical protein
VSEVRWDPHTLPGYGVTAPQIQRQLRALPPEVDDDLIEAQKPGNRGIMLSELQGILALCAEGDPDDPRWSELKLRCLDRMAKLLRLYEPQKSDDSGAGGLDPRALAASAAAVLDALEAKLRS